MQSKINSKSTAQHVNFEQSLSSPYFKHEKIEARPEYRARISTLSSVPSHVDH